MKKSLIALAALSTIAGSAVAQSSVEVYGRIDQGYNNVELKNPNGTTTKAKNTGLDGGVGGSRLGFRGTEDLGGGLKAGFVIEFGVDMGEDVGANKTRLGFAQIESKDLGTARIGRQVSPTKAVLDAFRPLSNNTNFRPGDFYYGGTRTLVDSTDTTGYLNADQRVSNAITYITPTIAGFSAQYQIAEVTNDTGTGTNTASLGTIPKAALNAQDGQVDSTGASLNYSAGNFAAAYAMFGMKTKAAGQTTIDEEVNMFAASYDFGVAKLHAIYSQSEIKASGVKVTDRDLTTVGVTVPVGKWALTAEYADGTAKAVLNGDDGQDVDGYKVRAMYNLSKRTGVYAQMGESKYKSKIASEGTTKVSGYNIGIAHTF